MEQDDRLNLVSRMFALLTAKLEDAAGLAAEGQGIQVAPEHRKTLADQIQAASADAAVIAEATAALGMDLH